MKQHQILIRLKSGVLDPQGKTVHHALESLGFDGVESVRVGKLIDINLDESKISGNPQDVLQAMCNKLLVNPVIEDATFLSETPVVEPDL